MLKFLIGCLLFGATAFANQSDVLLFSGSVRKDSFNKKLISEAARIARETGARVQVIEIKNIPHYDGDVEDKGMPKEAEQLRSAMLQSQVIIIATPEYNGSISGVLKDALDWTSRAPTGGPSRQAYKGKTFVLLSASPSPSGGNRAVEQLKQIILEVGGSVCEKSFSLSKAHEAFDTKGQLKNPEVKKDLQLLIRQAISGMCIQKGS